MAKVAKGVGIARDRELNPSRPALSLWACHTTDRRGLEAIGTSGYFLLGLFEPAASLSHQYTILVGRQSLFVGQECDISCYLPQCTLIKFDDAARTQEVIR